MRAYELMVIIDADLDDEVIDATVRPDRRSARPARRRRSTTDQWGRRRFAYEINHKHEGYYVVFEIVAEAATSTSSSGALRLADEVVRHKIMRLPDNEAARRGLLGAGLGRA